MQCKRDLLGKRIFSDEQRALIESFIYKYSEKNECFPIDAICEIREYMNQELDQMSKAIDEQLDERDKGETKCQMKSSIVI